ncbi:hypothetical protein WMW72_16025 [Paenibacillus filicis]|uniref:Uncharacterized protein n=1 Tax=Paenibacillus filicis TaxID=669464 RepID=A0ABU9DKN5_9BACL
MQSDQALSVDALAINRPASLQIPAQIQTPARLLRLRALAARRVSVCFQIHRLGQMPFSLAGKRMLQNVP